MAGDLQDGRDDRSEEKRYWTEESVHQLLISPSIINQSINY